MVNLLVKISHAFFVVVVIVIVVVVVVVVVLFFVFVFCFLFFVFVLFCFVLFCFFSEAWASRSVGRVESYEEIIASMSIHA